MWISRCRSRFQTKASCQRTGDVAGHSAKWDIDFSAHLPVLRNKVTAADDKIRVFESGVLIPALTEVSASNALLTEYEAEVVVQRPSVDAAAEELLESLAGALRRRAGPSLVLKNRQVPTGMSRLAGRYVTTAFYRAQGNEVYASPGVMFWMRFNNKLHAFDHRYDNNVEYHRVEEVSRSQVLNHILGAFDFYKMYAFSQKPFPGYG